MVEGILDGAREPRSAIRRQRHTSGSKAPSVRSPDVTRSIYCGRNTHYVPMSISSPRSSHFVLIAAMNVDKLKIPSRLVTHPVGPSPRPGDVLPLLVP